MCCTLECWFPWQSLTRFTASGMQQWIKLLLVGMPTHTQGKSPPHKWHQSGATDKQIHHPYHFRVLLGLQPPCSKDKASCRLQPHTHNITHRRTHKTTPALTARLSALEVVLGNCWLPTVGSSHPTAPNQLEQAKQVLCKQRSYRMHLTPCIDTGMPTSTNRLVPHYHNRHLKNWQVQCKHCCIYCPQCRSLKAAGHRYNGAFPNLERSSFKGFY